MILVVLLGAQVLLMFIDEFHFHRRRGLPTWEVWGHPVDALSGIAAVSLPAFFAPSNFNVGLYTALCVFSCLLITKDEWVHAEECSGGEQWTHAMLFMLHPTTLICLAWGWLGDFALFPRWMVQVQWGATWLAAAYQMFYWLRRARG